MSKTSASPLSSDASNNLTVDLSAYYVAKDVYLGPSLVKELQLSGSSLGKYRSDINPNAQLATNNGVNIEANLSFGAPNIVLDSNGTAITGALSVSSDITYSTTTATNIVANKMFRLAQVGDDFGESGVMIQNSRTRMGKCLYNKQYYTSCRYCIIYQYEYNHKHSRSK